MLKKFLVTALIVVSSFGIAATSQAAQSDSENYSDSSYCESDSDKNCSGGYCKYKKDRG